MHALVSQSGEMQYSESSDGDVVDPLIPRSDDGSDAVESSSHASSASDSSYASDRVPRIRNYGSASRAAIAAAAESTLSSSGRRRIVRFETASMASMDFWEPAEGVSDVTTLTEDNAAFYKAMIPNAAKGGVEALFVIQSRIGPSERLSGFVPRKVHQEIVQPSMEMIQQVFANGTPLVHRQAHGPFELDVKGGDTVVVSLRPNERFVGIGEQRETLGLNYVEVSIEDDEAGVAREVVVNPRIPKNERSDMGLPVTHIPFFFNPTCISKANATNVTICTEPGTQGITFPHGACIVLDGLGDFFKNKLDQTVSLTLRNCLLTQGVFNDLRHKAFRSVRIESCGLLGDCTLPKMSRLLNLHLNVFGILNASLSVSMRGLPMLETLWIDTRFRFIVRRPAKPPVGADVFGSWESANVVCVLDPSGRPLESLHIFMTHADILALVDSTLSAHGAVARLFNLSAKQVAIDVVPATTTCAGVLSLGADPPARIGAFVTGPWDLNLSPFNLGVVQKHHIDELLSKTESYESIVCTRIMSCYTSDLILGAQEAAAVWEKIVATGAAVVSVGPTLALMLGFARFGRSLAPARRTEGATPRKPRAPTDEGVQRALLRSESRTGPAAVVIGIDLWMDRSSVWVPSPERHALMCVRYPISVPELGLKASHSTVSPIYRHVEVLPSMFLLRSETRLPGFNETSFVFIRPDCDVYLPASATLVKAESDLETIRAEMSTAMDAVYPIQQPPNMCGALLGRRR